MEAPISLTDYIEKRKQRDEKPVPVKPRWLQWTEQNQKRGKDLTGKGPDAA